MSSQHPPPDPKNPYIKYQEEVVARRKLEYEQRMQQLREEAEAEKIREEEAALQAQKNTDNAGLLMENLSLGSQGGQCTEVASQRGGNSAEPGQDGAGSGKPVAKGL